MKNKETIAVVKILIAACGWGLIGVFSRPMSAAGLSAMQITFVRSVIVVVGMGLFLLAFAGCALVSGFAGGEIGAFALLTGIGSGLGCYI